MNSTTLTEVILKRMLAWHTVGAQKIFVQLIRPRLDDSKGRKRSRIKANPPHTEWRLQFPLDTVILLVLRADPNVAANGKGGVKGRGQHAPGRRLGSPFLLLELVEKLHLLPVGSFHHGSQLVHLGLQLQDVLGRQGWQ